MSLKLSVTFALAARNFLTLIVFSASLTKDVKCSFQSKWIIIPSSERQVAVAQPPVAELITTTRRFPRASSGQSSAPSNPSYYADAWTPEYTAYAVSDFGSDGAGDSLATANPVSMVKLIEMNDIADKTWPIRQADVPASRPANRTAMEINLMQQYSAGDARGRKKLRIKKRFKKFLLPLLMAYKLKFFTLIPVLIAALVLLAGSTGMAGFFFALFATVMGLKSQSLHSVH